LHKARATGSDAPALRSNYALSIQPQLEAAQKGYTQVLWLFGENQLVTEVGTMNMFVLWKNEQGAWRSPWFLVCRLSRSDRTQARRSS
jgi:branched-chain amino acid aminotransferase